MEVGEQVTILARALLSSFFVFRHCHPAGLRVHSSDARKKRNDRHNDNVQCSAAVYAAQDTGRVEYEQPAQPCSQHTRLATRLAELSVGNCRTLYYCCRIGLLPLLTLPVLLSTYYTAASTTACLELSERLPSLLKAHLPAAAWHVCQTASTSICQHPSHLHARIYRIPCNALLLVTGQLIALKCWRRQLHADARRAHPCLLRVRS